MTPVETAAPPRNCPKCGSACDAELRECPCCRVIFDKIGRGDEHRQQKVEAGRQALGQSHSTERLALVDHLLVRQQVERLEAWTNWEVANAYTVQDQLGNVLFCVAEESNGWARQLLKSFRPFTMHVTAPDGATILMLKRPYRFYFQELNVHDTHGELLGTIRKRFSVINRRYDLIDARSGASYEIYGPFFKPWTFSIRRDGVEHGAIRKSWSGLLREAFTDSDNFGIELPRDLDVRLKAVFLGAVFLIDFLHFEDNNND